MEREIKMSAKGYENQLVEQVKVLEEDNREVKREYKKLKKRKRKQKRLEAHEEEMMHVYEVELEANEEEIASLIEQIRNINFKEEKEEALKEKEEVY